MCYSLIKMDEEKRKLLIIYCENIMELLDSSYPNQKNYAGTIKKFYEIIISISNFALGKTEELKEINFFSLVREFVDDTTDSHSIILSELKKVEKILEELR